jgi:AraC family transcriptional regulator
LRECFYYAQKNAACGQLENICACRQACVSKYKLRSLQNPIMDKLNMKPGIVTLKEKRLVGKRINMSLANNKTFDLWRSFMPERVKINNNVTAELFSIRVYEQSSDIGDSNKEFEKWAAIEVSNFNAVPDGMETFVLAEGLYAVFLYRGSSADHGIYQYIYGTWLPDSNYNLDNRPHFEIMGEKYKNADPASEEEIWIPIKPKG